MAVQAFERRSRMGRDGVALWKRRSLEAPGEGAIEAGLEHVSVQVPPSTEASGLSGEVEPVSWRTRGWWGQGRDKRDSSLRRRRAWYRVAKSSTGAVLKLRTGKLHASVLFSP